MTCTICGVGEADHVCGICDACESGLVADEWDYLNGDDDAIRVVSDGR